MDESRRKDPRPNRDDTLRPRTVGLDAILVSDRLARAVIFAGLAALGITCGPTNSSPQAAQMGTVLTAMLAVADRTHAAWRCSGPRELAADAVFANGWKTSAGTLRLDAPETRELVIGIVADAGGSDPKTLAALGRIRNALDAAGAKLVVTLGGMGATHVELRATLASLAGPWPLVALPGDLEAMPAQRAAIADLRGHDATIGVVDGRGLRLIEAHGAVIGLIPGVGSAYRSVAGSDGCVWAASDVVELYRELSAFPGLRIAATPEAPREMGDGEASGEIALVPEDPIDVIVHGPTQPAPTAATRGGRDGARVALSPGTADATARLPPVSRSTAGLLVIRDRTWAWRPIVDPH